MQQKSTFKKISVDKPCAENWDKMQAQGANKFCQQCSKTVIDFSKMSDEEVLNFLENQKYQGTCGKFEMTQLDKINRQLLQNQPNGNFLKPILTAAFLTTATLSATAQTHEKPISTYKIIKHQINSDSAETVVIRGKLVDLEGEVLIGANVYIQEVGTTTNVDGNFELIFDAEKYDDSKIVASYIGHETLEINLSEIGNKEVEIILNNEQELLGEIVIVSRRKYWWSKITSIFR